IDVLDEDNGPLERGGIDLALGGLRDRGDDFLVRLRGLVGIDLRPDGDQLLPILVADAAGAVAVGAAAGVGEGGELLVPIGGPALVGRGVPGAAAQDALFAGGGPARILLGAVLVISVAVPVIAPLPDVAVHIEKAPAIGGLLPDRLRLLA